ncbi:lipid-A-disaccharide synthase N-terminal domain-containing protein [Salinarimonas rosea]|uniref:lipid-A-disaccharide synthase N-terminal domain-containing protein n=1 Tax=Salinarimonas rosea TaxID=552063 RepID=UPI0003FA4383|nr:lipid-A-disaccharide synthase N-terminal domain-containing protein [Salinarimonas rosea]
MIANLINDLGGRLHTIFIDSFDMVVLIGLLGQLLFTARFVVQWIASERAGKSVVPISFWFFSLGGGFILLGYAVYRQDPVFIIGQALGSLIYMRNLMLIAKSKRETRSLTS